MAAGTVISGGFPGRVAQEVQPNPKCRGCMHYADHAGRTGACMIGSRPWLCGDGEAQDIGYAPIDAGAGSYLPEMTNTPAQARQVEAQFVGGLYGVGSTRPVQYQQVSLGEEHVHIIKSMVESHTAVQRAMCRLCVNKGTIGTQPANVGPQTCTCKPIEARTIAKALVGEMTNAQRMSFTADELIEWVHDVAKAGFKMVPRRARSLGKRKAEHECDGEEKAKPGALQPAYKPTATDRSGGHLQLRAVKSMPVQAEAVDKSYVGDDWLSQFKGTSLFASAHKLCELELQMEEAQLERRAQRSEHEKKRAAALAKLDKPEPYDWEKEDAARSRIRIAKQKLQLKLAELQQKSMSKAAYSLTSQSDCDGDDDSDDSASIEKAISSRVSSNFGKALELMHEEDHGHYTARPHGKEGGKVTVGYHPTGGIGVNLGTFDSPSLARRAVVHHAVKMSKQTKKSERGDVFGKASTLPHAGGAPVGKPKAAGATPTSKPPTSHFKAPHGTYKIEHHSDHAVLHYKPHDHPHAPAQSVKMKDSAHAQKMAKIHAFVNDHDGEHTHATLHENHVAIHEPTSGDDGGPAVHKVRSMGHAREHLGY